jgi:MFS family permease
MLELPRRRWDGERPTEPGQRKGGLRQLGSLLSASGELKRLTFASFIFSGLQLSFVAFTTVQLTSRADFGLVAAGQALAAYQISGVITRPIWGWIADRWIPARSILVFQGLGMGAAALAAGQFGPGWPFAAVLLVCAIAGATASGYTGLAYAEFARLGGARRTEATGLGSAAMFTGVLVLPSLLAASGEHVLLAPSLHINEAAPAAAAGEPRLVGVPIPFLIPPRHFAYAPGNLDDSPWCCDEPHDKVIGRVRGEEMW